MEIVKYFYRKILPKKIREVIRFYRLEREFHFDAEVEFYGAYNNLRKYLRIKKLKYEVRKNINWAHGWYSDFFIENSNEPYMACCNNNFRKTERINLVTRKTQENFLRKHGFNNVKAVGMPIIYLPIKNYHQIGKALLVMPGHSLEGETVDTFEDEYVNLINSFRSDFKKITICVHPGCKSNGYWINTFKKHGYKVITGVGLSDLNAFQKLQKVMSEHEFMTTNCYGSHVMYASYFGSKVSIIGKEPKYNLNDFLNDESWKNEIDKSPIIESFNTVTMPNYRKHYPTFFVDHPSQAVMHKELADYELGVEHKIGKYEFDLIFNEVKQKLSDSVNSIPIS